MTTAAASEATTKSTLESVPQRQQAKMSIIACPIQKIADRN